MQIQLFARFILVSAAAGSGSLRQRSLPSQGTDLSPRFHLLDHRGATTPELQETDKYNDDYVKDDGLSGDEILKRQGQGRENQLAEEKQELEKVEETIEEEHEEVEQQAKAEDKASEKAAEAKAELEDAQKDLEDCKKRVTEAAKKAEEAEALRSKEKAQTKEEHQEAQVASSKHSEEKMDVAQAEANLENAKEAIKSAATPSASIFGWALMSLLFSQSMIF
eukprot:gnl/MRDRNA2_/MRDRNA2_93590_c0_seq1.p1 gnl/MRDRNA2_/MRDRNA2_93590_c0~~gnl/MRDRNA2_/MRDRNA2_93590_c0_seq1.p1  ORF type:complete len:222 (+),score=80.40 gnl/MRDRNA2_/MRDRNA2_93590_c0_seq1:62-727(+)